MTLDQQRAQFALKKVNGIPGQKEKYKTQLLKLPARLHTSGFGQTVAFYLSSGSDSPEAAICGWIGDWMREMKIYDTRPLIESIAGNGMSPEEAERKYRVAASEARALSVWLKRFAEAFLAGGEAK